MEKKKTDLKEILSFLLILAGSAILAINMNTFVEQGGLDARQVFPDSPS